MEPLTRDATVVQTVPAARVSAIAVTLVALPALAVFIVFAQDRVEAIVSPVFEAVAWGVALSLIIGWKRPPPLRIEPDELPPIGSQRQAVAPGVAFYAVIIAGAAAYSLAVNQYVLFGMILGFPITIWDSHRKARRIERELHGTMWSASGRPWRSSTRARFLVSRD